MRETLRLHFSYVTQKVSVMGLHTLEGLCGNGDRKCDRKVVQKVDQHNEMFLTQLFT